MKKSLVLATLAAVLAIGSSARAQEGGAAFAGSPAPAAGGAAAFQPFVVGAYISMGMAHSILDYGDLDLDDDAKPRFAGGGGAYFDFYLMPILALEGGISFIGKGARWKEEEGGDEFRAWDRIIYMEIPLGAKLNIKNFQASLTLGMEFALSGKTKTKTEIDGEEDENTHTWNDNEWDNYRRFNLCPRITLGYAIPVGPIAIVPGLTWMIEVINDAKDEAADADVKIHNMNLMINVGVEWGFGA